jgi:hypothetical protein
MILSGKKIEVTLANLRTCHFLHNSPYSKHFWSGPVNTRRGHLGVFLVGSPAMNTQTS